MITPAQIKDKAIRLYPGFIKEWLADAEFFPKRIPAKLTLPTDHAAAKQAVDSLRQGSKQVRGAGYQIKWETRKSRSHGLNEFPVALTLESAEDLLFLANKSSEFDILQVAAQKIRVHQPKLSKWLCQSTHWKDIINVAAHLDELLLMTRHLVENPRPNCFAREIALPVSTKLVEENRKLLAQWLDLLLPADQIDFRSGRDEFEARYGLRHVRHHLLIRCLDNDLQKELGLKFSELSLPADSVDRLACDRVTVFIVENKINLLTLPPISRGIAIGGLGKAVSLVRDIKWLANVPIFYWGDLDVEGFEILSQFRELFPHAQSLLMNMETFQTLEDLAIDWSNRPGAEPLSLTEDEIQTYRYLLGSRKRLEQERIPQACVEAALAMFNE